MSMVVENIKIDQIDADEDFNCRGAIAPIDVSELAQNIKEHGLLQPGIVMPHPDETSEYSYKLVAGFRRRYACKIIGMKDFPCVVKHELTMDDAMFFNLNENIQRQDLTILQEALAVAKIKAYNPKANREYCASKLGMSPGWVQMREMLLNLPSEVQMEVNAGLITQSQIRELNNVKRKEGVERCYEVAKEMKKAKLAGRKPRVMKKKNREAKRERKRPEIFEMMADINDSIPYEDGGIKYLWPKVMSWCAGEITDNELFEFCKEFCDGNDHNWMVPACDAREEVAGL